MFSVYLIDLCLLKHTKKTFSSGPEFSASSCSAPTNDNCICNGKDKTKKMLSSQFIVTLKHNAFYFSIQTFIWVPWTVTLTLETKHSCEHFILFYIFVRHVRSIDWKDNLFPISSFINRSKIPKFSSRVGVVINLKPPPRFPHLKCSSSARPHPLSGKPMTPTWLICWISRRTTIK